MADKEQLQTVEAYFKDLKHIHATGGGVAETSYYPALSKLIDAVGHTLKPKVKFVGPLKNKGAGMPDGGLFSERLYKTAGTKGGVKPDRGAIEIKSTKDDVLKIAKSEQVEKYLKEYSVVLVTNYRDFLIVEKKDGQVHERERFTLSNDHEDFWKSVVSEPKASAQERGVEFFEFMMRACLHEAKITKPKDLAWFLASYARDALDRVEKHHNLEALEMVRAGLEEALGMKFTGKKGEHFFRSTLVQTIFYGIFSAWAMWHRENKGPGLFEWHKASWTLNVPFVSTIFDQLANKRKLGPLNLMELLDWTQGALNRVDREAFFGDFQEDHAVQYFYEPFLEAFDPVLRKELGVWYTPPEIVKYQVERVDRALREELNIADGLADKNVVVLDPCCGTGAYLVEVLHRIAKTIDEKGADGFKAADLKKAAMQRVFGFEIMPAPFVVAHMQLGLLLRDANQPLNHDKNERVGVYLTNALTGWTPPKGGKQKLMYPELEAEKDAAEKVKRDKRILVVLGNPPYNAFAGVSPEEEADLVEPYKHLLNTPVKKGGWGVKKFNLDELYVRFFRVAERRIAEMSGEGIVSFISSKSYLDRDSFTVMRQNYLKQFDKLWLDCLNGDSRETGKITPDGLPDPSVFSTEYNKAGIRVGTAIALAVRKPKRRKSPTVKFRHFWGEQKREELLAYLKKPSRAPKYVKTNPSRDNLFSFAPENVSEEYKSWPELPEIAAHKASNGLMEKRGGSLIDIDREALETRMRAYFDKELSWEDYQSHFEALTKKAARFDPAATREKTLKRESYIGGNLRRFALRPFETQWCYYSAVRPVWNECRPALWKQCFGGNTFLLSRASCAKSPEGKPAYSTDLISEDHILSPDAACFPRRVLPDTAKEDGGFFESGSTVSNLSKGVRAYLKELGFQCPDEIDPVSALPWDHALAITYSVQYLEENADGVKRAWPRIPLPMDREILEASAALGREVAGALNTEEALIGVSDGKLKGIYRTLGNTTPVVEGAGIVNLKVTGAWGHFGNKKAVMPGQGKHEERDWTSRERKALQAQAKSLGLSNEEMEALLGGATMDIYLNDDAYWCNVPKAVWEYYIGGYQVIKKWLSYRSENVLDREDASITEDEAREVTAMVRRITALVLLGPRLDANYQACKSVKSYKIG